MTYRICFVCTGNICRSPMAEVVMRAQVNAAGLAGQVEVDSAGTAAWHSGDGADDRAVAALREGGYDGSGHSARPFERGWFAERDLVVALDRGHLRELQALAPDGAAREKVSLLRSFTDGVDPREIDVEDPYFGGAADFVTVLDQVEAGCHGILEDLVRQGVVAGD